METIEGYYDGQRIVPLAEIQDHRHRRVKITLLEVLTEEEEIRLAASHSDAFKFWDDPREDIYQDYVKS
ncbi:MAG TPA: hypothetical protein VFH95_03145 [Candidatus Kapabacteria bacterium]|nr:hypothetical protein [Candidatus Kapabacteria bacterium]